MDIGKKLKQAIHAIRMGAVKIASLPQLIAYAAKNGISVEQVSDQVKTDRLDTCKNCPRYQADTNTCGECGCFLGIKAALKFDPFVSAEKGEPQITKCPKGLWKE